MVKELGGITNTEQKHFAGINVEKGIDDFVNCIDTISYLFKLTGSTNGECGFSDADMDWN